MIKAQLQSSDIDRLIVRSKVHLDQQKILHAIGLRGLRFVDENFRAGGLERPWKPLQPNTVAGRRRGSNKPLMNSGRLRQSFVHKVSGGQVWVGTESQIAGYHEHGTRPYTIKPKSAAALRFPVVGGFAFAKQVRHTGLPQRKMLPSAGKGAELATDVANAAVEQVANGRR